MKSEILSSDYWNDRYTNNSFGWDVGTVSTPLKTYFDQLTDKHIRILIPGAGNAYEAEYLYTNGFNNIDVLDFAAEPLKNIKERLPHFPTSQLIQANFFNHIGQYDLIIEQTFFCAIHPSLRKTYAEKMSTLLKPKGKLVGLLFNDALNADTPPFGGNKQEYMSYFDANFNVKKMEPCYNSIKPREGRELFMILEKK